MIGNLITSVYIILINNQLIGGNNMNKHTEFRFFFVWDLSKEKTYLESMSSKGYHLIKVNLFKYTFTKGEPIEYVYDFDYQIQTREKDKHNPLVSKDWELVDKFGTWFYYRKIKSDFNNQYHPNMSSAIKMYLRVLDLLILIGIPNYMFFIIFFPELFGGESLSSLFMIFKIFIIAFAIMHISSVIKILLTIKNIRKYI